MTHRSRRLPVVLLSALCLLLAGAARPCLARGRRKPPTREQFLAKGGRLPAKDFLNVTQGTLFFTLTPKANAADVVASNDYRTVLRIRRNMGGLWSAYLTVGCLHKRLAVEVGAPDLSPHRLDCGGDWRKDKTRRVAIVYDCAMGLRVWRDGREVASNWGKDAWPVFHVCMQELVLGGSFARVEKTRVFHRALSDAELATFFSGGAVKDGPPPPASPERVRRLAALCARYRGLPDERLPLLRSGRSLMIGETPVSTIKQVRKLAPVLIDGDPNTGYPLTEGFRPYHTPGLFHLALSEPKTFRTVACHGGFTGVLYTGDKPMGTPGPDRRILGPASRAYTFRYRLDRPVKTPFVHVEPTRLAGDPGTPNDMKRELVLGLSFPRSILTGIRFLDEREGKLGARPASVVSEKAYHLTPPSRSADIPEELASHIRAHYSPADAVPMLLSAAPAPEGEVRLGAMRQMNILAPPQGQDAQLDTVALALAIEAETGTSMQLVLRDPEMPRIVWFETAWRLPARKGWSTVELVADPVDTVVPAGKAVWMTLLTTGPVRLRLGPKGSRVILARGKRDKVLRQYRDRMGMLIRQRFSFLSEPRPWGKVKTQKDEEPFTGTGAYSWEMLGELYRTLRTYRRLVPGDPLFEQMNVWIHPRLPSPQVKLNLPPESRMAPRWAAMQRECLKAYDDYVKWWIRERQLPNGEFGGMPGDDTDLVNDWASLYWMTGDETVRDSLGRIASYMWRLHMKDGMNVRRTDTLHAYEEGTNANSVAAYVYAGHPLWYERALRMTRAADELLMHKAPNGHRYFKDCFYGRGDLYLGRDRARNALMLHPANVLMWYCGHPKAAQVCLEWFDGWYAHGDGALFWPARRSHFIDSKTGLPTKSGARVPTNSSGYRSYLFWLGDTTRDPRVMEVLRRKGLLGEGFNYFMPEGLNFVNEVTDLRLNGNVLRWATAKQGDLSHFHTWMMPDRGYDWAYARFLCSGERSIVEDALERLAKRLRGMLLMHTVAEQSVDRVAVSKNFLDYTFLGGHAHSRNCWAMKHAVSWSGFGTDVAAWVHPVTEKGLRARLYNFRDVALKGTVRFWRFLPGRYRVRLGPDANGDGALDVAMKEQELNVTRGTTLALTLPPQREWILEVSRLRLDKPEGWARPDLAVCREDVRLDPAKRRVSIRVHNIGVKPAENFDVYLMQGRSSVFTRKVKRLEAPLDLRPRTVVLEGETKPLKPGEPLRVLVDARRTVAEINEENNEVAVAP